MDRYLSPILFSADFSGHGTLTRPSFCLKTASDVGFKEDWLRRAIVADPEVVIAACREADLTDEAWVVWAEEFSVASAGIIDVLLLSESGRVAIVETKLSYNPEGRRSVVAQALEYAVHLPEIDELSIPPIPQVDDRPFVELETVKNRLQEGDYLLIVAGDRLDSRAVKLSKSLLGRHLVQSWELALVEVSVFEQQNPESSPRFLLAPHLRGAIIAEQRQVVRIIVEGDRTRVKVEPQTPVARDGRRQKQNEESFSQELPVELRKFFDDLRALHVRFPTFTWDGASASMVFRNKSFNILELYSSGEVRFRPSFFAKALGKTASQYKDQLKVLFPTAIEGYAYAKLNLRKSEQLLHLIEETLATVA